MNDDGSYFARVFKKNRTFAAQSAVNDSRLSFTIKDINQIWVHISIKATLPLRKF